MRLEQLHVLYHENLCGWNSYYTTRTCAVGRTSIQRERGYLDDRCGWANLFSLVRTLSDALFFISEKRKLSITNENKKATFEAFAIYPVFRGVV